MKYEDFELTDGQYPQPTGLLRVWTVGDVQWACMAPDHTPRCLRDVLLDPTSGACIALVLEGKLEAFHSAIGGLSFRISQAGIDRVETAIRRGGFGKGLDA